MELKKKLCNHSEHEKEIYQTNKNNHIQWPHIASATANWQSAVVQWVFLHSQQPRQMRAKTNPVPQAQPRMHTLHQEG